MSRKIELILGLIGSIVGLIAGFWIINYGNDLTNYIQTFTYLSGTFGDEVATLGWVTVVASALALVASLLIKKKPTWLGCSTRTYRHSYVLRCRPNLDRIRNSFNPCWFNGDLPCTESKIKFAF